MGRPRTTHRLPKAIAPVVETRRKQPKRAAKADAMDRIVNTRMMFSARDTDPKSFFPFPELLKLHKEREARRIRKKQKQRKMENMEDGNLHGSDELVDGQDGSFGEGERPHTNRRISSLPTAETAEMACLKLSIVHLIRRVEFLEDQLARADLNVINTGVLERDNRHFQPADVEKQSLDLEELLENNNCDSLAMPTDGENSLVPTALILPSALGCITDPASFVSVNTATSASACASFTGDAQLAQAAISTRQPFWPATVTMMVDSDNLSRPLLAIASPEYESGIEEGTEGNQLMSQLFDAPEQKMSESMLVHDNDEENSTDASQHASSQSVHLEGILAALFGTTGTAVTNVVKRDDEEKKG